MEGPVPGQLETHAEDLEARGIWYVLETGLLTPFLVAAVRL